MISKSTLLSSLFILSGLIIVRAQGKFERQVVDDTVAIGYGLAIGDVDGDAKPDILLADKKQIVWYRNGSWKRQVLAENLTEHDNVCIAAKDIDHDGKVEIAVGAQWNPGETTDTLQSGSLFYLIRPANPSERWKAVRLHHEPTLHRIQWVKYSSKGYCLVAAPLHGRGNKSGEGAGAKLLAYFPTDQPGSWRIDTVEKSMHLTHNFFVSEEKNGSSIYLAGKEGINHITVDNGHWSAQLQKWPGMQQGAGEIQGNINKTGKIDLFATIEPMHGDKAVAYLDNHSERLLLDSSLKEGHALGVADLLQTGYPQVIVGWRMPGKDGKVGIKLYKRSKTPSSGWETVWIDENGIACEDLKIADLDMDGKPDIIASGRSSHNLVIYWNR